MHLYACETLYASTDLKMGSADTSDAGFSAACGVISASRSTPLLGSSSEEENDDDEEVNDDNEMTLI